MKPSEHPAYLELHTAGRAKHTLAEADFLYRLAAEVRGRDAAQVAVEIGTWRGLSAGAIALAGLPVVTCDPYEAAAERDLESPMGAPAEAWDTWARLEVLGLVEAHVCTSLELASRWDRGRCVGLLFVDGSHYLDAVLADIRAWRPYLARGAVMAFHDYPPNIKKPSYRRQRHVRGALRKAGLLKRRRAPRVGKLKAVYV